MSEEQFVNKLEELLKQVNGKVQWGFEGNTPPILYGDLELDGKHYLIQMQEEYEP